MPYLGSSPARGLVGTANIDDDAITLAKMAHGTANQNISYDGSGVPVDVALSAGKVLQVVQTVKTDTTSTTSTSATDISGMSVAITPAATSSKVLVQFDVQGAANPSSAQNWHIHLLRGSSAIFQGDAASSRTRCTLNGAGASGGTSGGGNWRGSMAFLDSPSSTSELTYKLQWEAQGDTLYLNREYSDGDDANAGRFVSHITVMEIGT